MTIRPTIPSDAPEIARLTTELGYEAEPAAIAGRLARIAGQPDHLMIVAFLDGKIVGWLQAHASTVLESGFRVEITGLVVDSAHRGRGVGRSLVRQAEQWAAALRAETVVVRSNLKRTESHRFYPALGYELSKTQAVYRKRLTKEPPVPVTSSPAADARAALPGPAAVSDTRIAAFPPRLETERLYLRPYAVGDAAWYHDVARRNHEHLARFESGNAAFGIGSEAEAAAVLRSFEDDWRNQTAFFLGAFLKGSDTFVAQICVGVANATLPEFTLGFFADVRHEGNGYVAEASRAVIRCLLGGMQARRVTLWCDETNERSWRLAERCGFRREGHLRQNKRHPDGTVSGSFCYGLVREEKNESTQMPPATPAAACSAAPTGTGGRPGPASAHKLRADD
jgi:aminoglycoside 6'-N-acetyltransferase